jgi:glycosyltransferase involved in cell wall biosynthesis
MEIWLIYPYGSIPGEGFRPDRVNMLAEKLCQAGHNVTWWGSNYEHRTKKFRSTDWKDIVVSNNLINRLVPTIGYVKNISINRICSEIKYANQIFSKWEKYHKPDMIIMGEPSLFISRPIMQIVKKSKSAIILDMGDLWPELFHIILHKKLHKLGNIIYFPFYNRRRRLFNKVDAIVALSNSYLKLARKIAPKLSTNFSDTVYYGMDIIEHRNSMKINNTLPDDLKLADKKHGEIWAIYASTLGNNYDIDTLLGAGIELEKIDINVKIIIAGAGPLTDYVRTFIIEKKLTKIIYVGNPDSTLMASIYSVCDIGLSMYLKSSTVSMPIKAFHYFASGLPIINSLGGDLCQILKDNEAGINYEAENIESLVNAIKKLVNNSGLRNSMSEKSFQLGMTFDIDYQYNKFLKIIEKVAIEKNIISNTII